MDYKPSNQNVPVAQSNTKSTIFLKPTFSVGVKGTALQHQLLSHKCISNKKLADLFIVVNFLTVP